MSASAVAPGARHISPRKWPPWTKKLVVAPAGYAEADIEWVPIAEVRPGVARSTTWSRPMVASGPAYPALVLSPGGVILDGHHRYWILVDGRWQGTVPAVRKRRR